MSSENIFISAASAEFESFRIELSKSLSGGNRETFAFDERSLSIKVQGTDSFKLEGGSTIEGLADFLGKCEVVIHLIGDIPGTRLKPPDVEHFHRNRPDLAAEVDKMIGSVDWSHITYTQLEAYLARCLPRKRLIIAVAASCPRQDATDQIDHLKRLRAFSLHPHIPEFHDVRDLENKIWRHNARQRFFLHPKRPRHDKTMPKIYGGDSHKVFGREDEQQVIDAAWASPQTKILGFIAGGGVGKSTVVMDWLARFHPNESVSVFAYSFYFQGQTERQVATDAFFQDLAEYFEFQLDAKAAPYAKGEMAAKLIMHERCLIILDGLEPLQEAGTGRFRREQTNTAEHPHQPDSLIGRLTDNGAWGFLQMLVNAGDQFEGLCILTSRVAVTDLNRYKTGKHYIEVPLEGLHEDEGAEFLKHLKVDGTDDQRRKISRELGGHALALLLTGTMIRDRYNGQIQDGTASAQDTRDSGTLNVLGGSLPSRNELNPLSEGARHTFKVLDSYVAWFQQDGLLIELELLRILGLFDRAAELAACRSVMDGPVIPGLTNQIHAAARDRFGQARSQLRQAGLIADKSGVKGEPHDAIDAHPLIRQYFSGELEAHDHGSAYREGHRRLYEYYANTFPEFPEEAGEMSALYRALSHCCLSGNVETAFSELLLKRAWRLSAADESERNYSTRRLGMISADFVALTQFFTGDLEKFESHIAITGKSRFTLLTDLAMRMRSLGRIQSAQSALAKALENFQEDRMSEGYDAVNAAAQLAELQLISGNIYAAAHSAERAIRYADHPDQHRTYFKFHARTSLADALLQQGKLAEAGSLFEEAKRLAEADPDTSPEFLYSQTCYRYGLYLIESGREDELIALARRTEHWGEQRPHRAGSNGRELRLGSLLSSAIDQMILAEALVRQNEKRGRNSTEPRDVIEGANGAIAQLMQSGYSDYLARGLNIAARYHTGQREFNDARIRLEQNQHHVERGGMRLLEVDYLCELCRFHIMQSQWDAADETCRSAQRLANEMGYGRRKQELQQFRDAIGHKRPEAAMHRAT